MDREGGEEEGCLGDGYPPLLLLLFLILPALLFLARPFLLIRHLQTSHLFLSIPLLIIHSSPNARSTDTFLLLLLRGRRRFSAGITPSTMPRVRCLVLIQFPLLLLHLLPFLLCRLLPLHSPKKKQLTTAEKKAKAAKVSACARRMRCPSV
eukprot:652043-Rhodomonas_salina.2